jgi:RimJ/RimL family protein N-acetyltransferase
MPNTNLYSLQTKRLILNSTKDINSAEIKKLIKEQIEIVININKASDTIKKVLKSTHNQFWFDIVNRIGDILIGYCGISVLNNMYANCFYFLFPQYRSNGYAIEAIKKVFDFTFNSLKLSRLNAYIQPSNQNAWKVAERVGMMYMGETVDKINNQKLMVYLIENHDFSKQNLY